MRVQEASDQLAGLGHTGPQSETVTFLNGDKKAKRCIKGCVMQADYNGDSCQVVHADHRRRANERHLPGQFGGSII